MRRSRHGGFAALWRIAENRRRSENARMLISIAGVAAFVALLARLLSG